MEAESARPLPLPDHDDEFFWIGLRDGLMLPRCRSCGFVWLRPTPACPRCGATDLSVEPQSGMGTVYSWVVVDRALDAAFADEVPYTVVTVELDCGARLPGRLLGTEQPRAGMAVEFEAWAPDGVALPGFRGCRTLA